MNTNANRGLMAAAELERITADLSDAQADFDLLERLKSAADRVKRLTAEQQKAAKELTKARTTEAQAAKDSRCAQISDIQVTDSPETMRAHVLRAAFPIPWLKPTWDGRISAPQRHSATGFGACPPDVLDCLIDRCPQRIPAKIMALAPDNPREAFRRYFVSLKRGHIAA